MSTRARVRTGGGPGAEATTLIGRRAEIARVRRLLSTARLITLTGVGGVGKTRLALRVARDVEGGFPDGVHTVEFAGLREAGLLAQTVATALGLAHPGRDGSDGTDAVAAHLRDRQALLVLDNCEHLVDACARLADTLLRAAPGLRILTTSRHTLGITAEHVFPVEPLAVVDPDAHHSPGELLGCPAVALFAARGAAVRPGFTVTDDNAETVARLVHRLDGLPFAIELAAARLRALTPQEILDRLTDRFALLTTGSRTAAARQRTLRELIDWSHALCTDRERALWARASVFSGGFDLEGVEGVCAGDDLPAAEVLDVLDGLVEKSILTHRQHDGRSRYHMLETVREYGRERLAESGHRAALRRRHRDHCLRLTRRAQEEWFGPRQVEWFTRLRLDHANLRTALEYCLQTPGETAAGLAMAIAPRHYWIRAGSLAEGRRWLARLLATADDDTGPLRTHALATYAYLGILQGRPDTETLAVLSDCALLAERHGDGLATAWIRHHRGMLATWRGDHTSAADSFERARTAFRAAGLLDAEVECTVKQAIVHAYGGDAERAARLCHEATTVTEAYGEAWLRGLALFAGALLARRTGEPREAAALARRAIRLIRPFHDWWDIAMCVEVIAWSSAADPRRAARLLGVLHLLWESIGVALSTAPFMREEHRRFEEGVRAALTAAEYDRAFRRGADATVDQALAFVLDDTPPASTAGSRPAADAAPLTRREWQVADLVAAGLTNKQIAAHLVIAQRTAENHVERIRAKLGLASRSQLAVWAHERRQEGAARTR
ncbi:LuxR family transcriptional regulator [Streptomyces misionensis]|uniref:LuxR family transcriptional regulator n=1 Tax=Streptomyces misionensis TaxID=67331 RepID=A0A5C6JWH1_9ACTN|nr:LuxR C-terminal-related transcriptional regulator [Streptomyces misionensis]TWV53635.1 LuxR family transcriptional regulator [Streptomyces misionensis]